MNRSLSGLILLVVFAAAAVSLVAQTPGTKPSGGEKFSGAWAGTFEGDATGKFEMTISPGADGKHSGSVSVTPDSGEGYTASFKSVSVEGDKIVVKYDSPDGGSEVALEGTGDGKAASGKWVIQSQGSQSASGTWKTTRKADK